MTELTFEIGDNVLEQALQIVKAAGYRVSKPKEKRPANGEIKAVNPLNHPYPHAKLYNISLSSISRLSKYSETLSQHMTK